MAGREREGEGGREQKQMEQKMVRGWGVNELNEYGVERRRTEAAEKKEEKENHR